MGKIAFGDRMVVNHFLKSKMSVIAILSPKAILPILLDAVSSVLLVTAQVFAF